MFNVSGENTFHNFIFVCNIQHIYIYIYMCVCVCVFVCVYVCVCVCKVFCPRQVRPSTCTTRVVHISVY